MMTADSNFGETELEGIKREINEPKKDVGKTYFTIREDVRKYSREFQVSPSRIVRALSLAKKSQ